MKLQLTTIFLTLALILTFSISFSQTPVRFYQHAKAGYKNPVTGVVIVEPKYDAGSDFREGFAIVMMGRKRGYINEKGEVAIPLQYDDASQFFGGLARVTMGGKNGYINYKGEYVIQPIYNFADDFIDGLARVARNGKFGFINTSG